MNSGIDGITGVSEIDFTGVDFTGITDLSQMYTMDDLLEIIFAGTIGLDGNEVTALLAELDSLNYLDVTGIWNQWDINIQTQLLTWNAIDNNILLTPEPATFLLLALGAGLLRKRRKA